MSRLFERWATWLKGRLRDWLDVPTDEDIIDRARDQYRALERRLELGLKERERALVLRERDMERLVGETTLAVEKTMTAIQMAERNWQAVVKSQEKTDQKQAD